MKVLSKKIENQVAHFTIGADLAEIEEYLDKACRRMVNWETIPGFEKGKAPREALEKHFGREMLLDEANKELIPGLYNKVLAENEMEIIGEATVKIIQKEPLIFDVAVALKPTLEIGDYRSIRLPPEQPEELPSNAVDAVLESIQRKFVDYAIVDRLVKIGDILTINFESTIMGAPFIQGKGKQLPVSKDYPPGIPELHEHLIGMKTNEEREFKIKIADDYTNTAIAGKEASFKVKVIEIYEERIPELNDSLAQLAAPDLKTMDSLRERITKNLKLDYEEKAKIKFEEKLMAILIEKSKLEVSPMIIESETESMLQDGLAQLRESCESQEDYEYKLRQVSKDKLREKYKAIATKRVLWDLILSEIAKKEAISASSDEIEQESKKLIKGVSLREMAKQRKMVYEQDYQDNIKNLIIARKTIAFLSDIATGPINEGVK
jgi:trigger factor